MEKYLVAKSEELAPGGVKIVQVNGKEIGLFFENGNYYAILNVCPHNRAEICRGHVNIPMFARKPGEFEVRHDTPVLQCPWHHWEFYLDGGKAVIDAVKHRLKTFPIWAEGENIYIEM
jgi:3-phenylpropionate/trans-cinnamate dioxygenase ferredoxin subunit